MRKLALIALAAAVVGFAFPLAASTSAEAAKVVVKTGDRGHHYGWRNKKKKVVVIKRGHRHHHHHRSGARVIVR